MMHLDGFHADLFRVMLEAGMLPHFDFLLSRGKLSTSAATVDKSETFKVIQSYLTSRLDTEITASPIARPNKTLIRIADNAMTRKGRMLAAMEDALRDVKWVEAAEGEPFQISSIYPGGMP